MEQRRLNNNDEDDNLDGFFNGKLFLYFKKANIIEEEHVVEQVKKDREQYHQAFIQNYIKTLQSKIRRVEVETPFKNLVDDLEPEAQKIEEPISKNDLIHKVKNNVDSLSSKKMSAIKIPTHLPSPKISFKNTIKSIEPVIEHRKSTADIVIHVSKEIDLNTLYDKRKSEILKTEESKYEKVKRRSRFLELDELVKLKSPTLLVDINKNSKFKTSKTICGNRARTSNKFLSPKISDELASRIKTEADESKNSSDIMIASENI